MDSSDNALAPAPLLREVSSKSNKTLNYFAEDTIKIQEAQIAPWTWVEWLQWVLKDIFLPKGYPESVSSDYLEYQLWDTCQAFCSSISGTLAMSAVMKGIGVGSETATPVSAAVTWLIKDGTGMIGSIIFAWLKGSQLDTDCKKWRLFADILNDMAMFIELCIPLNMEYCMQMLCVATAFKALVGTAGSSTRAALVTHQAIKGNIADVSAKDGSQEICTNLFAFVFGILILKNVTETKQVWTIMCTATFFHLIFNYNAVKSLKMDVFNNERLCISLQAYLPTSHVPSVKHTNSKESVFLFMGAKESSICGFTFSFGNSFQKAIKSKELTLEVLTTIISLFDNKRYIILPVMKKKKLYVAFEKDFKETDVLKAHFHACLLGLSLNYLNNNKGLRVLSRCLKQSPLFRLKNLLQVSSDVYDENYLNDTMSSIIVRAYACCDDFVDKEFVAFSFACEEKMWNIDKHLIIVNNWLADWNFHSKKKRSIKFKRETQINSLRNNSLSHRRHSSIRGPERSFSLRGIELF